MSSAPAPLKLDTPIGELLKKLFFGGGVGAGALVAYLILEAIRTQPKLLELVITVVGSWGPFFILLLIGMYFANARLGEGIQVMRENTAAQQKLADAVSNMASKDNAAMQELTALITYIGAQQEKILERLRELPGQQTEGHE